MQGHRIFSSLLIFLVSLFLIGGGPLADFADAKSRSGGRSFSRSKAKPKPPPLPANRSVSQNKTKKSHNGATNNTQRKDNSFVKGMAGGFLGSALGSMLFGSLLGAGGSGMGLLPLLLLGGIGWLLYRQFNQRRRR